MHLPLAAVRPETRGLVHRANLIDPRAIISNATKIWPRNWATTMVPGREAADTEVVAAGIQPMGEVKAAEATTTQVAAITLMVRATRLMTGGTRETFPIQHHVLSRMIPATWSGLPLSNYLAPAMPSNVIM
jgi:hypothetical protein